jgi:heterotetrameric sarcosine oxidase alpha subunit
MSRLVTGGLIDRGRALDFTFDGKSFRGFEGDTLASALVANGVQLVGRSFKYHRPRGILTAGSEEPNALVTLRGGARAEPNTRATTVQLFDGLQAVSQNRWPSLDFDLMAVNSLAAPIFVAGFYYKTFMWPAAFWEKLYEPLIRRAAGLGRLSTEADPDIYDHAHAFCDVLVVGGGPAGLCAALTAGRSGARVILVEEDWLLGGRLLAERHEIDGTPGIEWAKTAQTELDAMANVTVLTRTALFGAYDGGTFGAVERVSDHLSQPLPGRPRQRLWKIVAKRTVLATGALERPLVFGGNDRPGVMTASAVRTYVNRFAATPGARVAIFTTTDSGWATADELRAAGVNVTVIIDARPTAPGDVVRRALRAGSQVLEGAVVVDARGGKKLNGIDVRDANGRRIRIATDVLAMAGGWNPVMGIGCNLGSRPVWSDAIHSFVLDQMPAGMFVAGSAAGRFSLADALGDGARAGSAATTELGFAPALAPVPRTSDDATGSAPLWHVSGSRQKAFVDFQHDVTDSDVELAVREGFKSVEHLKRYTTLGMATDQGKTSQINGHGLLAMHTGKTIEEVGTVLSRPPYLPVAIGTLAGHHRDEYFRPGRRTASHHWAIEQGATFVDSGQWKRAQWFARSGDADWLATVTREVVTVRERGGICDVSTLGKIDVLGPDAGALLDRLYINTFSTLPVGKARYGVMLREDGFVMDDGTTTRLADDHFFVTTTTVNAARVMQHIDYCRQVLWPKLNVQAVSVTEQWAQFAVAGPQSRTLLQRLLSDMDLSNDAFPFMSAAAFTWRGVPARLFRLSFSGELAYEIAVPANYGDSLVRELMEAGCDLGVIPYGTEALGVLRIEKGHAAGNELNGQTTAADLGFGRMMSKKKNFIGRVMAGRSGLADPMRPALVGLRPVDSTSRLRAGAHLIPAGGELSAAQDQGYVTSVAYSPSVGSWIGLAMLRDGPNRLGERVCAYDPLRNGAIDAEVCNPIFVDPEGARVRG